MSWKKKVVTSHQHRIYIILGVLVVLDSLDSLDSATHIGDLKNWQSFKNTWYEKPSHRFDCCDFCRSLRGPSLGYLWIIGTCQDLQRISNGSLKGCKLGSIHSYIHSRTELLNGCVWNRVKTPRGNIHTKHAGWPVDATQVAYLHQHCKSISFNIPLQ